MVSFAQMLDLMENNTPLMDSGVSSRTLNIVRIGRSMHKEGERSFWDEFIELCSNTDGFSELLGISPDKIRNWPAKIKDALNDLETFDSKNPTGKEKSEIMPTGETGAWTTNSDPPPGSF